jgi:hypothetical protein
MEKSANISNLTKALAQFHALVGKIGKDAKNPYFKSNYASLPHILTEVSDPLQQAGLVITQFPDGDALTTMLIHAESGEYISASYIMPVAKVNDPQALGSAISYARRYSVSSILSLKIDDDDAEQAMKSVRQPQQAEDARPWLNKSDFDKASDYLRKGGNIEVIKAKYRISREMMESLNIILNNLSK